MAKKKSRYDIIEEEIQNYMMLNNTSFVPKDELMDIFESNLEVPIYEVLKSRWLSARVSNYLGRKRDEDNRRIYLSDSDGNFTNVEKERDINVLDGVLEQLGKRQQGLEKSIDKVRYRKFIVEKNKSQERGEVGGV